MSDPHVSPALKHLRFGVSACAGMVALSLIAYLLIFALIHYTDIRFTRLDPPVHQSAPVVVVKHPKPGAATQDPTKPAQVAAAPVKTPAPAPEGAMADANLVPSTTAIQLRGACALLQTVGVIGVLAMAVLMLQGVVIAGGGSVPGVEKAVTASSWCLALALLAIPWRGVMPEMVYPGVFQSFDSIAHQSDVLRGAAAGRVSGPAFFALHVLLPVCMLAGTAMVALRFRSGIERGIIATHASQLEEQIEREIRERKLGELSTPRAVGALNKAIGLGAGAVDQPVDPGPQRSPDQPASVQPMSARVAGAGDGRRRAI